VRVVVALWLLPIVLVAFALRTIAASALRRRHPEAAAWIDRWWVWTPFVTVLGLALVVIVAVIVNSPVIGIAVTLLGALILFGALNPLNAGRPSRPRRR
jgi:hypothetical protein